VCNQPKSNPMADNTAVRSFVAKTCDAIESYVTFNTHMISTLTDLRQLGNLILADLHDPSKTAEASRLELDRVVNTVLTNTVNNLNEAASSTELVLYTGSTQAFLAGFQKNSELTAGLSIPEKTESPKSSKESVEAISEAGRKDMNAASPVIELIFHDNSSNESTCQQQELKDVMTMTDFSPVSFQSCENNSKEQLDTDVSDESEKEDDKLLRLDVTMSARRCVCD
jgi:hypothetical protein